MFYVDMDTKYANNWPIFIRVMTIIDDGVKHLFPYNYRKSAADYRVGKLMREYNFDVYNVTSEYPSLVYSGPISTGMMYFIYQDFGEIALTNIKPNYCSKYTGHVNASKTNI